MIEKRIEQLSGFDDLLLQSMVEEMIIGVRVSMEL